MFNAGAMKLSDVAFVRKLSGSKWLGVWGVPIPITYLVFFSCKFVGCDRFLPSKYIYIAFT